MDTPKAHPVDIHVGGKIRERRLAIRMSQETLAGELGITFQAVQNYEKAASRVSASRLFEIARVLGVAPAYFFEGVNN